VVTIYDYGVDGDTRAFLVMELLNGIALRDLFKQHKRLPPPRIVEILRGVCAAVEAAHQRDLIHRDLKPENIFIVKSDSTAPDVVKVLDFGIAKFLPSHDDSAPTRMTVATDTGVLIGTPAYMSPEQLMGQELNVRWDLWALTVVVYEALTGALPFAGGAVGDWSRSILTGNFTPLSVHLNQPPDRWQTFFNGAFTGQRPHSAAEFFTRLEEAFAG
jgi:serine/threonine-protein kinase